ncbi:MAG: hypothetical protein VYC59_02965, partial [Chloroflexota bacterium]|nr:hypothetical protein [Chloroflexota bacterium]
SLNVTVVREKRVTVSYQASGDKELPKGDCIATRSFTGCLRVFGYVRASANLGSSRPGPC